MPKKDAPFSGKTNKFIAYYVDFEDLKKAALHADLSVTAAEKLYRDKAVRTEIDRRLDKVHNEQAKLLAKARHVTVLYLDDRLVEAVKQGAAKGDTKGLEMGYKRIGLMRSGEFMTAAQSSDQSRPQIYRALERTVTRTEQVTERTEIVAAPEPAALPEPPTPAVEVLDY